MLTAAIVNPNVRIAVLRKRDIEHLLTRVQGTGRGVLGGACVLPNPAHHIQYPHVVTGVPPPLRQARIYRAECGLSPEQPAGRLRAPACRAVSRQGAQPLSRRPRTPAPSPSFVHGKGHGDEPLSGGPLCSSFPPAAPTPAPGLGPARTAPRPEFPACPSSSVQAEALRRGPRQPEGGRRPQRGTPV